MTERQEIIDFCLEFPHSFEDYPFDDINWTVMRRKDTKKGFAWIFERENKIWVNVKVKPDGAIFWRDNYKSVIPAYHMNKTHWNSIILDGSIPDSEIKMMISESFELCGKKSKSAQKID